MTRNEYTDRVISVLRRVTPEERDDIRTEIDAHIEDHVCDLLGLGYNEALAEERTMALMGDPEEVGRELDKQYPLRWLVLGRIALILTTVLCIQAFMGVGILFHARDYLIACIAPEEIGSKELKVEASEETDYRAVIGNDILKVYQVRVGERRVNNQRTGENEKKRVAELSMCAYDRVPFGIVSGDLMPNLEINDQHGAVLEELKNSSGGKSSWGAVYAYQYIPIQPGDTYVTLSYDRFGESVSMEIPLPEVTP